MKKSKWMKVVGSFDKDGNKTEKEEPMTEDEVKQFEALHDFMFSSRSAIKGWEIIGELPDGISLCRHLKENYITKFSLN